MTERFQKLSNQKKEKIIRIAMNEFAKQGYEKASTNTIVNKAGIGKGMLFYYFLTKKGLFDYLVEYSIYFIQSEYLSKIDSSSKDFIERYKHAAKVKMEAYINKPHIFKFMGNIYLNDKLQLSNELTEKMNKSKEDGMNKIYGNIDASLFREDIPESTVFKMIKWSVDGYQNELIEQLKGKDLTDCDFNPLWDEFDEFLELLKKVYYKTV